MLAEIGAPLLVALVWSSVFLSPLILFSVHPLVNSVSVFAMTQSILILQPTTTKSQKEVGAKVHGALNFLGLVSLLTGVVIIEYNKIRYHGPHFHSVHAYLGVITTVLVLIQYAVGVTMFKAPRLYGGVDKAKAVWKYHRRSGYLVLLMMLATVASATQTDYNKNVLHIKLWAVLVLIGIIIAGVFPRIKKAKLGL